MGVVEKPDQELIEELKALHDCIHVSECYDTEDLVRYTEIWRKLSRRGYKIRHECKCALVIEKLHDLDLSGHVHQIM